MSDRIGRLSLVRGRESGPGEGHKAQCDDLRRALSRSAALDDASRLGLYFRARWFARKLALSSPRFKGRPLVFMKRNRFVCQMLHEYMAYFYDYGDVSGGGVYLLDDPGNSERITDLIGGRLPRGNYTTLAISPDAGRAYFAFAERAPEKPSFHSPSSAASIYSDLTEKVGTPPLSPRAMTTLIRAHPKRWHRFCLRRAAAVSAATTHGNCATYTPTAWIGTAAISGRSFPTRRPEWHPSVLHDGRIVYIRWDYVDRSAANFHGLWATNPDGSGAVSLFGNYTMRINACYQPKAIPGSRKIVFVAGAHHANVGGSLVLLDPSRTVLDPATGEDGFGSLETLTPEVGFSRIVRLAEELLSRSAPGQRTNISWRSATRRPG